jgi:hypothetical protein
MQNINATNNDPPMPNSPIAQTSATQRPYIAISPESPPPLTTDHTVNMETPKTPPRQGQDEQTMRKTITYVDIVLKKVPTTSSTNLFSLATMSHL